MKSKRKAKSFIILGVIVVIIAAVAITAIVNKDKIKQIFELKDGNVVEKVVEDIVEEPEPEIEPINDVEEDKKSDNKRNNGYHYFRCKQQENPNP